MSETEERVFRAKTDDAARNALLSENKKFILVSAYKAVGHYVSDHDDEYSVALLAFNEAIDAFDEGKGSFEGFASLVIRRRLLNHLRSNRRFTEEMLTEPDILEGDLDGTDEPGSYALSVKSKVAELSSGTRQAALGDEIDALEQELVRYGIDFFDLEAAAPKAGKTKESCLRIIGLMKREPGLVDRLRSSGNLPVREITEALKIHKKVLERHRKFIITATEIVCGYYPLLSEYIPLGEEK